MQIVKTNPKQIEDLNQTIEKLKNQQDPFGQIEACKLLAGKNDKEAISALCAVFKNNETRLPVRHEVLRSLRGTTSREALETLCKVGFDRVWYDRRYNELLTDALKGTSDKKTLSWLCTHGLKNDYLQTEVLKIICGSKEPIVLGTFREFGLRHTSVMNRAISIEGLRVLRTKQHFTLIRELALKDPISEVRLAATEALQEWKSELAQETLRFVALHDKSPRVRAAASKLVDLNKQQSDDVSLASARIARGDASAAETLRTQGLTSSDPKVRESSARALTGTTDVQATIDLFQIGLNDKSSNVRRASALALTGTRDSAAITALYTIGLMDEEAKVRKASVMALRGCLDLKAQEALRGIAENDSHWDIRIQAILAFKGTQEPSSMKWLSDFGLKSEQADIRYAAITVMCASNNPRVVNQACQFGLVNAFQTKDFKLLLATINALKGTNDKKAIEILCDLYPKVGEHYRSQILNSLKHLMESTKVQDAIGAASHR